MCNDPGWATLSRGPHPGSVPSLSPHLHLLTMAFASLWPHQRLLLLITPQHRLSLVSNWLWVGDQMTSAWHKPAQRWFRPPLLPSFVHRTFPTSRYQAGAVEMNLHSCRGDRQTSRQVDDRGLQTPGPDCLQSLGGDEEGASQQTA